MSNFTNVDAMIHLISENQGKYNSKQIAKYFSTTEGIIRPLIKYFNENGFKGYIFSDKHKYYYTENKDLIQSKLTKLLNQHIAQLINTKKIIAQKSHIIDLVQHVNIEEMIK